MLIFKTTKTISMKIPAIPRSRAFIESPKMAENAIERFSQYTDELGETYSFYFGGIQKAIVTTNPTVIQHILQKNYKNYHKSDIQIKRMGHFLGAGLLTSHGDYWLAQRRMIQEGFHRHQLMLLIPTMKKIMDETLEGFDNAIEKGAINITEFMMRFTFRIAATSLFSTHLRPEQLDTLSNTISNVQQFMLRQIVQPYLNPWFKVSGTLAKYEKMRETSDKFIMDYIKLRRKSTEKHNDMLQKLMDARDKDTGKGMTDQQVLQESMQLLVAGHETSSNALSWIFYMLHQHPEVQAKVRAEVAEVMKDDPFDYTNLRNLTYTIQVIEETLRLYPPFWMIDRKALETDQVGDLTIPKGATIIPFIYGVQHSSKYWEHPEQFNPNRFTKENMKKHKPFTHIPFGGGPRVCIGGSYAQIQILLILATILQKYNFELAQEKVEMGPMIILRPKGGIQMKFSKIH
jgi:cytochrome P450